MKQRRHRTNDPSVRTVTCGSFLLWPFTGSRRAHGLRRGATCWPSPVLPVRGWCSLVSLLDVVRGDLDTVVVTPLRLRYFRSGDVDAAPDTSRSEDPGRPRRAGGERWAPRRAAMARSSDSRRRAEDGGSRVTAPAERAEPRELSLEEVLKSYEQPINEEQAWAVCYQCCSGLRAPRPGGAGRRLTDPSSLLLHRDGTVSLRRSDGRTAARPHHSLRARY
ncbi:Protein spire 2 [Liparis tanakae]|uniref:Protein spire 2 n=1 Tax=Liparis tanakae TaxID=230148 RepID=A0A4Z2EJU2_9TELE|nr:Protein spire 2 [Liparis tanakae]